MGYRTKQRILNWRSSNGQKTLKKIFNIFNHQGNVNQNNCEIPSYTTHNGKLKNTNDSLCWRGCGVILLCPWRCKLVKSLWKSVWWFLRKLEINLFQAPAIPLLGIYPKDAQLYYEANCSIMFIAALFVIARTWKQPRCPSKQEWIKKTWPIYTLEYYSMVINPWHPEIWMQMNGTTKTSCVR